jgi:hypothetical protein
MDPNAIGSRPPAMLSGRLPGTFGSLASRLERWLVATAVPVKDCIETQCGPWTCTARTQLSLQTVCQCRSGGGQIPRGPGRGTSRQEHDSLANRGAAYGLTDLHPCWSPVSYPPRRRTYRPCRTQCGLPREQSARCRERCRRRVAAVQSLQGRSRRTWFEWVWLGDARGMLRAAQRSISVDRRAPAGRGWMTFTLPVPPADACRSGLTRLRRVGRHLNAGRRWHSCSKLEALRLSQWRTPRLAVLHQLPDILDIQCRVHWTSICSDSRQKRALAQPRHCRLIEPGKAGTPNHRYARQSTACPHGEAQSHDALLVHPPGDRRIVVNDRRTRTHVCDLSLPHAGG